MKFMWGLLLGFALGVAAGLLLAPQSGEATRSQLGEQSVMLRDRSGGMTGDLRSRFTNMSSDLRNRATDAMAQGQEMYSRTKDELSDRYGKAKSGDL